MILIQSNTEKRYLKDRALPALSTIIAIKPYNIPITHAIISDKIPIPAASTRFKDAKGNLTFDMDICRDGVQEYLAEEIYDAETLAENDISGDTILRVYRPPDVVFNPLKVKAFDGLPLTREHPKDFVDQNNRAFLEKGINRGSVYEKDKATISGTGFVTDQLLVQEIDSGSYSEVSAGYDSELEFEPGTVPEGVTDADCEYDLIMQDYEPNHIAIVKEGRAGNARIHDENNTGGKVMSFIEKLLKKSSKIKDALKKAGKGATLRMLADEEPDEEKKAVLDELATEAEAEDKCDADLETEDEDIDLETEDDIASSTAAANSETVDGDGAEGEEVIAEQKRVIEDSEKKIAKARKKLADIKGSNTEVLNMKKEELAELISVTVNDAINKRIADDADENSSDIIVDQEPTVVEEFEVAEGDMDPQFGGDMEPGSGGITAEALYEFIKTVQDPEVANLLRAAAQKLEASAGAGEEAIPGAEGGAEGGEDMGMNYDMEPEPVIDEEIPAEDAPAATEEARLKAAASGAAPTSGTPSNQGTEAELEAGTKDGEGTSDPVTEKDGYFISKKIADEAKLPMIMGKVLDAVTTYNLEGIDPRAHLMDGTIFHRVIDASGIGKVISPAGITEANISMAVNAIRANRPKSDGMASLVNNKLIDAAGKPTGFNPADEL